MSFAFTHRLFSAVTLAASLLLTTAAAHAESLIDAAAAKPAPAWTLTGLDGKPVSSEALKGKVVVVDFWATWCGPCVAEIPGYVELSQTYADQGLVIVGVSVDQGPAAQVKKFVQAKKMTYPVGIVEDDKMMTDFGGVEAIPTTFIIDREGRIRFKKVGAMEKEEFETLLKPLL